MSTITTYRRIHFDPLDPDPNTVDERDIAHALSLLCRAGGHFEHFYSVAQHSINCAKEALARGYSRRVTTALLLHDASEAYLSDVTRPVKAHLSEYLTIEERLQGVIYEKYLGSPLSPEEALLVKEIDDTLLYHEFLNIMGERVYSDERPLYADCAFATEDFQKTENEFLSLLEALTK